jgi:hypothetical protein
MPVTPIQEGGRFAVVVPKCPKETHYLLMPVAPIQKGGRLVVFSCLIQEGGRFAAVVPNSPKDRDPTNLKRRPLRGRSYFSVTLPTSSDPLFIDASCTNLGRRP